MTPAWLRAHFDPLPHPARASALARYARTLTPGAYASLYHTLDAGSPDERQTALFLAVARRDLTTVANALADPLLRRRALAAALRLPVPEQALEQLALSPVATARHETYRVLRLSRRSALAARILPAVHRQHGAREAALLLPACPADTVAAWLPRLDPPEGVLHTAARTAPVALARLLATRLHDAGDHNRHRFARGHRAVASLAARRDPEAGLLLLAQAPDLLTGTARRHLLRWPDRMLEILRAAPPGEDGAPRELPLPAGPLPPATRRALRALPPADLADLASRCSASPVGIGGPGRLDIAPDGLLALLPAPQRHRLLRERTARTRTLRTLPLATLAALAPADRARLVRPWLERWSRRDWMVCRIAPALPLAEGEPLLRALTEHHRSYQRALAWPALLACAELEGDPQEFARVAGGCERAWHDQDEVRRAALGQLSGAPARLLVALPDRVLRDAALAAVQSRDSTAGTLAATEKLLRRTAQGAAARGNVERAAYAVKLLCDAVSDPRLRRRSTRPLLLEQAAAQAIWAATPPRTRERADSRVHLAELLVPHLPALPDLDALVRQTALEDDDPQLAACAAAVWVAPESLREQRCAELVGIDAWFATVPRILETLATRRTDLMHTVLTAASGSPTDRSRSRPFAWAPRLRTQVTGRWLPTQRQAWRDHHARVATDDDAPLRFRADAAMYLSDPGLLITLADTAPQPVAVAALGALVPTTEGLLDGPYAGECSAATPEEQTIANVLLRHATTGGARGRAALGALRGLLKSLPDQDVLALLDPIVRAPDTPVGSRKEAARALADLPDAVARDALVAAWDAPGQHRDVRAVLARALVASVEQPGIADRLLQGTTEPAVREIVIHARVGTVSHSSAQAYRSFLGRLVREGDRETAVAACKVLPVWSTPHSDDALRAVVAVVVEPRRSRREWHTAARQLTRFPFGANGTRVLTEAFRELQERAGHAATQERVEALRRLAGIAEALEIQRASAATLDVADALAASLSGVGLRREAARLLWATSLAALGHGRCDVRRWEALLALVEERPERLPLGSEPHLDIDMPRAREALLTAVRALRERGSPVSGLLAIALIGIGGRSTSWSDAWQRELEALRGHDDEDTATTALLVATGRN
ncbi:hypothetical protein RB200_21855 [Streptomyces sp. PmtG]